MMSLEFYEANRRYVVAVRIRMKKLGRKHRPFFRICAVDSRAPRDGRVLEEHRKRRVTLDVGDKVLREKRGGKSQCIGQEA